MKKIISFFILCISITLFAQDLDFYRSYKSYEYGRYETPELVKMKTELYLRKLILGGYKIKKNEVTQSKIDIDFIIPYSKGIDYVKANLVYEFNSYGYSAALYYPEMYLRNKKKWIDLKGNKTYMKNIIDIVEEIVYKDYQTEINSNF
ncbi:hypothetical protein CMV04_12500 [Elizabethkingia anophelis]|nr:hypothetical protein [Elizabethkingia anophelis]